MDYLDNVSKTIDTFSSKTFNGEDHISIDVPENTCFYIQRVLTIICRHLLKENTKPFDYSLEENRVIMHKTNFNSIDETVSPSFMQEIKKSIQCCMFNLTLNWTKDEKDKWFYPPLDDNQILIKKAFDKQINTGLPSVDVIVTFANSCGINDITKSNREIYSDIIEEDDNNVWVGVCGTPEKILDLFTLMRELSKAEKIPSLTDMVADYILKKQIKPDSQTLPQELTERINDRSLFQARLGIKDN